MNPARATWIAGIAAGLLATLALGAAAVARPDLFALALPRAALAALLGGSAAAQALALRMHLRTGGDALAPSPSRGLQRGFTVLVLTAAFYLALLQPYDLASWSASVAIACGIHAAWTLCSLRPHLRTVRLIELLVFELCVVALLGELALRTYGALRPGPLFDPAYLSPRAAVERHRGTPGAPRFGFPLNSRGHYDEEPPPAGTPGLVVSIGDSFSTGVVPHAYHFTSVCEGELDGVDIYNMGVPAIGPAEYAHLLVSEALPLDPELVLVNLFLGNDLEDPERRRIARGPLGAWLARDNLRLDFVPRRLARLRAEQRASGSQRVGAIRGQPALVSALRAPEQLRARFPWLDDPELEQPTFSLAAFQELERRRAEVLCAPGAVRASALLPQLEAMLAAAGDTPLAFVLIPDEFQVEDDVWARVGSSELERFGAQRDLAAWLRERGLPYLDLLAPLRAVAPVASGRRHVYHLQDTHFNARGNLVVGKALADFVRSRRD